MPNKKILVSNDAGKYKEISGSISDGQISSPTIIINTSSFSLNTNGLLQVVNGKVEAITGSGDNYKINYSTELGKFVAEQDTIGDLGGDLSGLYTAPKVKSVANVTTGILSSLYGGTGQSTYSSGSLVTSNGAVLSPAGNGDKYVAVGADGKYVFIDKSQIAFSPMTGTLVYLYTGSVGSSYTATWTKPEGARFIRVICQGAGGGGGSGLKTTTYSNGSGGGGGGGLSDVVFNAISIPSTVTCSIGGAGSGGAAGDAVSPGNTGGNGGSSSFGSYIFAGGGFGGLGSIGYSSINSAGGSAGGAGGTGYTEAGAAGGGGGILNTTYNSSGNYGRVGNSSLRAGAGGGGGGAGVGNAPYGTLGGNGGPVTTYDITGGIGGANGNPQWAINFPGTPLFSSIGSSRNIFINLKTLYVNNILTTGFPNIIYGGGGGGGGGGGQNIGTRGSNGIFGSGGGGGGSGPLTSAAYGTANQAGGDGGNGYVLIICY